MIPKTFPVVFVILIISSAFLAETSFEIPAQGCAGGGCHSIQEGIVNATQLSNLQVQVAVNQNQRKAHLQVALEAFGNGKPQDVIIPEQPV